MKSEASSGFLARLDRAPVQQLPALIQNLDQWVLTQLEQDTVPLEPVFHQVSRFNEKLTARLIQEAVSDLETGEGLVPPLPFCWITLGSDARGEQVVRTDQDNALIFADPVPGEEKAAAHYFGALAGRVNQALAALGFDLCPGQVMASNPFWCRSLTQWLTALDQWVGSSDPMAVRHLTILLDFKAVFGDRRLAALLQYRVFESFDRHKAASHFLVRDDRLFAPPKTIFNRIRTKKEAGCRACFNLKTQAIAHIVNGARLFAVNHHIQVPGTLRRLAQLDAEGVLAEADCQAYTESFIFLTRLKIRQALNRPTDTAGQMPANHIDVAALDPDTRKHLDQALDAVAGFQKQMAKTFNQAWMNFFN